VLVTMETFVMILGWVGAAAGVIAYAMVSRGRWTPSSAHFQLTNLGAAGLMGLVAAANGVWPSVFANVVWIVIGVQAVVLLVRARRRRLAEITEIAEPAPQEVGLAA
jgi:peptidoglycan/LPS O-acetylase OafA/YrhL